MSGKRMSKKVRKSRKGSRKASRKVRKGRKGSRKGRKASRKFGSKSSLLDFMGNYRPPSQMPLAFSA